jgi:inosine/xanthosine triphosphatase
MKTIVVASRNPVKVEAALNGFRNMFPNEYLQATTVSVPSNVAEQPFSSAETLQGAYNRAANATQKVPAADFWLGIEGGVEEIDGELAAFAWVVVQSPHQIGRSRTGTFYLPPQVAYWLRQGKELGEADDLVFNRSNSKQENGAVGLLTSDALNRVQLYEVGVVLALIPFKNPGLYPEK